MTTLRERLPGPIARLLGGQRPLLLNAGSLFGATLLTAGLGAVYWAVAARIFPAQAVGVGAAAISSMQLLAQLATFGLGTMLMGELAEHHASGRRLILSSLSLTAGLGAALGVLFVLVSGWLVPELARLQAPAGVALFAVGVAVSSSGLVLDQALLGLLRGGIQLLRNGIASVAKLVVLAGVGLLAAGRTDGILLLLTWVAGSLVSMVVLGALPGRSDGERGPSIWRAMEGVAGLAVRHHVLNLTILAPGLLLPLLITAVLSAESNAYFYVAYLIASFAWALPAALATAGYATGSRDVDRLPARIRVTFWVCLAAGIVLNLALVVAAPPILAVFGSAYAERATTLLRLLGLGIFPVTLNSLYVPIARVERRFLRASLLMAIGLIVEFAFVAVGAMQGGLAGAGVGWLIGYTLGELPFLPTVIRVAVHGRVERLSHDALGRLPSTGEQPAGEPSSGEASAREPAASPRTNGALLALARVGRARDHALRHANWSVGLVDAPIDAFLDGNRPQVRWLPRLPGTFAADPFGIERDGVTHVFLEVYDHDHGRGWIAHQAAGPGDAASDPSPIIDVGGHASYPFLLEADAELWLVPETADLREVRLYRAADFPTRWVHEATLLRDVPVSDPTIVHEGGRWWLFGTSRGRGVESALRIWHAPALTGPWRLHGRDPVKVDVASSRPAGTPFRRDGVLHRPAQDNSHRYGGRVVVNRVTRLTTRSFSEEPAAIVEPLDAAHPDGVHTLAAVGHRTLVDGNALRFVPAALGEQLRRRLRRRSEEDGRVRLGQRSREGG